ncbi:aminotransferase class I/II-fold pyridoxal phosphate-dependent enzyme [Picrophilus oshimae]|uniref:Cystathionine beta-lyase n=1 Tax=Picrophilus torridus (strain ATCC 700027 / DSM 9790 / JCM 10055 / NBRC 100828 / KAW 2/3) TaxID=1122961 RepID=A0A8G2FW91_PICTO|nr:aminotransferase class I/II-fold pyridoxal phosphate-dependent enzyme [Picrophilus oshimae]SMD30631.1 cystathionine beta-lyase [Picrophilus oshimae DSM 9789]
MIETDINDIYGRPLVFPIYQTGSYEIPGGEKFRYSREYNPTVENLNNVIKRLEHGDLANSFSSGMGAITTTLLSILRPGDEAVTHIDTFARSYHFFSEFLRSFGIKTRISRPGTENILEEINKRTKLVFIETLSNPVLRVYDIDEISKACSENGALLICDSTFATPYNLKTLDHGADVVIHSASKFLSGHNDVIAGVAAGSYDLIKRIDDTRRSLGTSMDPNTAFLVERGIKTLDLRMEKINENAMKIARFLNESPRVSDVIYPGLESHPDHGIASRLLRGYSGVILFKLKKDFNDFIDKLSNIKAANTLGGLNTIVSNPYTMSHRSLNNDELKILGIDKDYVRLSAGIENPENIIEELNTAIS